MCPSIKCLNCGSMTYHRGRCENEACGYAPFSEEYQALSVDLTQIRSLLPLPALKMLKSEQPFKRLVFFSVDRYTISTVASKIGYKGCTFFFAPGDDFLGTELFGFEFVNRAASTLEVQFDEVAGFVTH